MAKEDILNFEVRFYSPDEKNSPVIDYIKKTGQQNSNFQSEMIAEIFLLPENFFLFRNIKHFKAGEIQFYELRVKHKNNIARFFFTVESPKLIIIHGFTKKHKKHHKKTFIKASIT